MLILTMWWASVTSYVHMAPCRKGRVLRQTGPARCLVLALCVLRTMSVFVCLCSSVVGGWRVSVFSVSASVGPWVCAPAFVRFVLSLIVFVAFPLKFMVPRERLGLQRLALERHNCEGSNNEKERSKQEKLERLGLQRLVPRERLGLQRSSPLQKVWSPGSL